MPQYVEFIKSDNRLVIKLLPEGRQLIEECQDDPEKNIESDAFLHDLLEHQLCNGWTWVRPEQIGALTDAPILSDDVATNDDGDITHCGVVYWFERYQIESPVQTLLERGEVRFPKGSD